MAWYRVNTCSLTSGSPAINGASTAWVANAQAGDAFKGPDEKLYEVQSVNSDTSITLASNYTGTTAAGAAYAIITLGQRHAAIGAQKKPAHRLTPKISPLRWPGAQSGRKDARARPRQPVRCRCIPPARRAP